MTVNVDILILLGFFAILRLRLIPVGANRAQYRLKKAIYD